ncbi:hypothetical protein B0O99DRAFT_257668 [Bisporella sp. PMI_857]|nr:hypothetical protein B0O99DRAFT_257668 [Bisporella sp. PMI_857]
MRKMSLITTFANFISGGIFGASLTAAGVYSPAVIVGQMKLTDFQMLKTFITASLSSAVVIFLARKLSLSGSTARRPSSLSLVNVYDGNILGGLLIGLGMIFTGACPGTVFPQFILGIPSAPYVLLGGLIGGILFTILKPHLPSQPSSENKKYTIHGKANISEGLGVFLYEAFGLAILQATRLYFPERGAGFVQPVTGGLLIGLAQACHIILTGNTLNVSGAYEQLGAFFLYLLSSPNSSRPALRSVIFAAGVLAGTWTISHVIYIPRAEVPEVINRIGKAGWILGGIALSFGARIAGGCTSGHGISGMGLLGISSFVSVAAMFAGGIVGAVFL